MSGMSQNSAGCGYKAFTNLAGKIGMHILFYTNKIMLHKLEKFKFEAGWYSRMIMSSEIFVFNQRYCSFQMEHGLRTFGFFPVYRKPFDSLAYALYL